MSSLDLQASEDIRKKFKNSIKVIEDTKIKRLEDLKCKKVILRTQSPTLYNFPVNIISLSKVPHLIYIRSEYNIDPYNSCTNGFHYFNEHIDIKNYIPFIPNIKIKLQPQQRTIGFYYRPWLTPDSCKWFMDNYLHKDIPVVTMGKEPIESINKKNWYHTTIREEFFSLITDYIYVKSLDFVDPFPTSLCEAVQCNKRIKIVDIGHRDWKDGIDDIEDCIKYDRSILNFDTFISFYEKMIENGFDNRMSRNYKTMDEWIIKSV